MGKMAMPDSMTNKTHSSLDRRGFLRHTSPVPEPAALAIFALGLAGLGMCRRKNVKRNAAAAG